MSGKKNKPCAIIKKMRSPWCHFALSLLDVENLGDSCVYSIFLAATKQLYEWYFLSVCLSVRLSVTPFYPSALRAGGVLSSRSGRAGGRAGGCQTCGTHISATAQWIFSIRSSVELSRPVGVHCNGHMPICLIWACPWAKNLSNLPQIGSRLCGTHISETAGWIYPI